MKRISGLESNLEKAGREAREARDSISDVGEGVAESTQEADSAMRRLGITSESQARRSIERLEEAVRTVEEAHRAGTATAGDVERAQERLAQKTKRWARLTETQVDNAFTRPLRRAQERLTAFGGRLRSVGGAAGRLGAIGGAALTGGLTLTAREAFEVQRAADVSGLDLDRIQEAGFAAQAYGVTIEDLGDKLKDVNDKFADFFETGAGPLKDFFENVAPQIGLDAAAFEDMDALDRLLAFVEALEKSGRTLEEGSTFYLEGIASDMTALLPLLENGGEELESLIARFRELGLGFTEEEIASFQEARQNTNELGAAFQSLGAEIMNAGVGDAFDQVADMAVTAMGRIEEAIAQTSSFLRESDSGFAEAFRNSSLGGLFGYDETMPPAVGQIPAEMRNTGPAQPAGGEDLGTLTIRTDSGDRTVFTDRSTAEALAQDARRQQRTQSVRSPRFTRSAQ